MSNEQRKYCLLHPDFWSFPGWIEDCGSRYVNEFGGFFNKTEDLPDPIEVVYTNDYASLDHRKTGLFLDYDPEKLDCWIDPAGRVYYCKYRMHDEYADLILKSSTRDLEAEGWARCHGTDLDGSPIPMFFCNRRLTAEQRNVMSRLGFTIEDHN